MPELALTPTELRAALRDFHDDYAACLDAVDLARWPRFFADDCMYQVIARENHDRGLSHATIWCDGIGMVEDRAAAIRETAVYEPRWLRHFVSGIQVRENDGDTIRAEASFMVIESLLDQAPHILMVGRYLDTFVWRDDALALKERLCVFENHHVRTSLVLPL